MIIIGYSGAKDRVTELIFEALEDPNSLPYGLWWAAYKDESAVFEEAREMIAKHERAFLLDPGKDAEQITRSLCQHIGIDDIASLKRWTDRLKVIGNEVNRFLQRASFDFRKFQLDAAQTLLLGTEENTTELLAEWKKMQKHLLDHNDPEFVADLHTQAGKIMMMAGQHDDAIKTFKNAINLLEKVGKNDKLVETLMAYGDLLLSMENYSRAEKIFTNALAIYS